MNDVSVLSSKLNYKLVLIEKPYFYTDGKKIRSEQFPDCEKMYLKPVEGTNVQTIAIMLNKEYRDKHIAVVKVESSGAVTKIGENGKVSIECLIL